MTIISLALPEKLLRELDQTLSQCGYTSRSEAVRDSIRSFISKFKWASTLEGNFISTIMFTYVKENINIDLLTKIEHEFDDIITTNIHMHLKPKNCLEILVLKGTGKRIRELVSKLSSIKNINNVEFVFIPT